MCEEVELIKGIFTKIDRPIQWVMEHQKPKQVCTFALVSTPSSRSIVFSPRPVVDMYSCLQHTKENEEWYVVAGKRAAKAAAAILGQYLTNYPTYHVMKDGGVLCQKCLEQEALLVMDAVKDKGTNEQWEYADTSVNYEKEDLYCDHCEERIPSAYND